MRIVVNDIAASGGGARTVLESFYRYVREFDTENEWVFLLGSDLFEESHRIRTVVLPKVKGSWLRRLVFDLISGRRLIRSLNPDVVFSLQNTHTYGVGCPQVVYVHQSLPFQQTKNFSLWRRDERSIAVHQHLIGAIIKQSIRRADAVIVQTTWVRDAIIEQLGIREDRIRSILLDLDDLKAFKYEGPFDAGSFFYPTAPAVYKNNDLIYAACRLLREQGFRDFKVTMTLDPPSREPEVEAIGRVSRERVLTGLARSTLIFPSYIETYGLPLAEARALGTLVLAADLPYSREVLEGYENAYFFDWASPSQLAAQMRRIIAGKTNRHPNADNESASRVGPAAPAWSEVMKVIEKYADAREDDQ